MLIPRFSMRLLLVLMTASALFCYVVAMAIRGHTWAVAITLAVCCVFGQLALYATTFLGSWGMASVLRLVRYEENPSSPFATAKPPPQIIPPQEPE